MDHSQTIKGWLALLLGQILPAISGAIAAKISGDTIVESAWNALCVFAIVAIAMDYAMRNWERIYPWFFRRLEVEFDDREDVHHSSQSSFRIKNRSFFRLRKVKAYVSRVEVVRTYFDSNETREQAKYFKTTPLSVAHGGDGNAVDIDRNGVAEFFFVSLGTSGDGNPMLYFQRHPPNYWMRAALVVVTVTVSAENAFAQQFYFTVDGNPVSKLSVELAASRESALLTCVKYGDCPAAKADAAPATPN